MKFSKFMSSTIGRILRIAAGLALIIAGLVMHSMIGYIMAIVGLVPLLAGIFDFCVIAPLMHIPFNGKDIRVYQPRNQHIT